MQGIWFHLAQDFLEVVTVHDSRNNPFHLSLVPMDAPSPRWFSGSTRSKRSSSSDKWLRQVSHAHRGRSPDRTRINESQQWEVCLRKCRAVKGLAFRTRGLVAEGLHQLSATSSPQQAEEVRERWKSAQTLTRERLEKRFASLDVPQLRSDVLFYLFAEGAPPHIPTSFMSAWRPPRWTEHIPSDTTRTVHA